VKRGDLGVGEQFVPPTVTPEILHAHQGFVSCRGPELAGALETTLILASKEVNAGLTHESPTL
jgi:hypothetical protein